MKKTKQVLNNLRLTFLAQFFSLILSLLLSLWLPKYLTISEYGYWQLFLFYAGYTGLLHLGLADGVYLKHGGVDFDKLNCKLFKGVFIILLYMQLFFSTIILLLSFFFSLTKERLMIVLFVSFYSLIYNLNNFFNLLFQATNQIKTFSKSSIIRSFSIILLLGILIFKDIYLFQYFVVIFICGHCISLLYNIYNGRKILERGGQIERKLVFCEVVDDISIGINLMIANITSMLIIGIGRLFIDKIWGITTFAIVSLSLSLVNFFLLFINQVGIVLFPLLRRATDKQLQGIYMCVNVILTIIMPAFLFFYYPICLILDIWLPQYFESLKFFALLVPICLFEGKMQMLYNTYLKVLRKEKFLFKINLVYFLISVILCVISGYILTNMHLLLFSIVFVIVLRSLSVDYYLSKKIAVEKTNMFFFEIILIALFISTIWYFSLKWSFFMYSIGYTIYLILFRKHICKVVIIMKKL